MTSLLQASPDSPKWWPTKDGDPDAHRLMSRHYSRVKYADGRPRRLFVGPGEKSVFVTSDGMAVFVWRKFIDDCELGGVNCAAFRNETEHRSSDLIREACELAWMRWPGERLYTYVNPAKVRSTNPGCCFLKAGWKKCGTTKGGLLVLEIRP